MLANRGIIGRLATGVVAALVAGGIVFVSTSASSTAATGPIPLRVQVEAAAGYAAVGNASPADILVLVTDQRTGRATTDLAQSSFAVISHFTHPQMTCGFSNNIVTFNNVGTGAYQIHVAPVGCNWAPGDFLLQVIVSAGLRNGQGAAKFAVPITR